MLLSVGVRARDAQPRSGAQRRDFRSVIQRREDDTVSERPIYANALPYPESGVHLSGAGCTEVLTEGAHQRVCGFTVYAPGYDGQLDRMREGYLVMEERGHRDNLSEDAAREAIRAHCRATNHAVEVIEERTARWRAQ